MSGQKLVVLSGILCGTGVCPTVYECQNGDIVVQGALIEGATEPSINMGSGEGAVIISRALLEEAASKLQSR